LVKDGDIIVIDAKAGKLTLNMTEAELAKRKKAWRMPKRERLSGGLEKYAALVGPANLGAVTHSGGKKR
jgi:dihydroxy-acid dehydratase